MTLEEMLRELIAERGTDPAAASWQDAAQLLLFLASDAAQLPPLLVKLALRGATAELEASAVPAQDVEALCDELTEHSKACIRRGELLRDLSRIMQALRQEQA